MIAFGKRNRGQLGTGKVGLTTSIDASLTPMPLPLPDSLMDVDQVVLHADFNTHTTFHSLPHLHNFLTFLNSPSTHEATSCFTARKLYSKKHGNRCGNMMWRVAMSSRWSCVLRWRSSRTLSPIHRRRPSPSLRLRARPGSDAAPTQNLAPIIPGLHKEAWYALPDIPIPYILTY